MRTDKNGNINLHIFILTLFLQNARKDSYSFDFFAIVVFKVTGIHKRCFIRIRSPAMLPSPTVPNDYICCGGFGSATQNHLDTEFYFLQLTIKLKDSFKISAFFKLMMTHSQSFMPDFTMALLCAEVILIFPLSFQKMITNIILQRKSLFD